MSLVKDAVVTIVDDRIARDMANASTRWKKNSALDARARECKELEITQKSFGMFNNILSAINSMPVIGTVGQVVTAGIRVVSHIAEGGLDIAQTALDCGDIPFEQIKELINQKFNELDRKLEQNTVLLEKIYGLVTKTLSIIEETREEMRERFDEILVSIENAKIEPIISQINNFISYFETESARVRGLKLSDYVSELEIEQGVLSFFKNTRTPSEDSLYSPLLSIIKNDYAIPDHINDEIAFKALYALVYGIQTYFSVFLFLIEQYSYLANYYYDRGEIDKYRGCFGNLNSVFTGFKASLVERDPSGRDSLIGSIVTILSIVKKKDFVGLDRKGLYEKLNQKIETFEKLKDDIKSLESPLVTETPENFSGISFTLNINPDIGEWIKGKGVRYAVQYERQNDSQFVKIKDWSTAITVQESVCPALKFPSDTKKIRIFRKFESGQSNQKVQLVGTLEPRQINFLDIDRDLYNAAENPDIKIGSKEARIFLSNGADILAVFEKGRNVVHAAAKSANAFLLIKFLFCEKFPGFNIRDNDGYTPIHVAAQAGNAGIVKLLLTFNADVNAQTNRGLTALHIAAKNGFTLTVQKLLHSLEINIYAKDKYGFTPLHNAVKGGKKIMEAFIKKGVDDINVKSNNELTPFHLAIINNDLDVAEVLRRTNKVDVNSGDSLNMTPLHYAAMLGDAKVVNYLRMLPDTKMNIVTKGNNWSPLHYAIFFKKDDAALELLKSDLVDKHLRANGDATPLHFAVTFERKRIISELVKWKELVEEKTKDGFTALHLAALRRDTEIISILLNGLAYIEAKTNDGMTPLQLASNAGRSNNTLYLLKRGADFKVTDKDGQTPIHIASLNNEWEIVKAIVEGDPESMKVRNREMDTPLNLAAQKYHNVVVTLLVEKGANVNAVNIHGVFPLQSYVKAGDLNMVKFLVEHNADVYITDNYGISVLYIAIARNFLNLIQYFIEERKFDWNQNDFNRARECTKEICTYKHFAFCDAIGYGKLEVVKYFVGTLKESECDPLHFASFYGQLDIVKYLIEEGKMNVDGNEEKLNTPLCIAVKRNHLDVVEYLVRKKANISAKCEDMNTAIDLAIHQDNLPMVKFLSENGADLRHKNEMNYTPFMMSFVYGKYEITKYFLEYQTNNININEKNGLGQTCLHLAVMFNEWDLVKLLVEKGIYLFMLDYKTQLAVDYSKNQEMYDYLIEKMHGRFIRSPKIWKNNYNLNRNYLHYNSVKNNRVEDSHQKYSGLEKDGSNINKSITIAPNIDLIGTLLLLDVIIRHITNKKYVGGNEISPDANAQVAALKITEKFENITKLFEDIPDDKIDISEIHKNIYKAIKRGSKSEIHKVICSGVKSLASLKPDEMKKSMLEFIGNYHPKTLPDNFSKDIQVIEDSLQFVTNYCLDV